MPSSLSRAPQSELVGSAAPPAAAAALKASLTDLLDDMSTRAARIICTEVPAYLEASDPRKVGSEHLRNCMKMVDMAIGKDPTCRRGQFQSISPSPNPFRIKRPRRHRRLCLRPRLWLRRRERRAARRGSGRGAAVAG